MKISNSVTLDNGQLVKIGNRVLLDNDKVLLVQGFNYHATVNHTHDEGQYMISGINVNGIDVSSGDFASVEKYKVKSLL